MSGMRFPGSSGIPVDERIVAPESRAEIIDGTLHFSPPAEEKHAVPHASLAYVLRAHVRPGFLVAIDMLTRSGLEQDFAPDASVYEEARDAETGGRRLEQLAFEVVNEQALASQTTKARRLSERGVRRVFVLVVKKVKLLEWSTATDAWSAAAVEEIDDPCLVRPLRAAALVSAVEADDAVLRALREKGHAVFDEVRREGVEQGIEQGIERGIEQGIEQGIERGLRVAVSSLCEVLGLELTPDRQRTIEALEGPALQALLVALKRDRAWP